MQLNPYLYFAGDCAEAFKFYEQALGGKIVGMMTHAETPMVDHVSADWRDKIIHARLVIGDGQAVLMGSDAPPEYYSKPQGSSVSITVNDPDEAERIFKALSENGTVRMPIQETFWAHRFGMLTDRFGQSWMVNCEKAL
ncbi:MAG TPA: VOC family protein [Armatimonadota bacterium]|nr:VOC family protein [Armatimonadota bacterium]